MNFVEILKTFYRSQFLRGQFSITNKGDGNGTVIDVWNVPGIEKPTYEQVMALYTPELEYLFNFYKFIDEGQPLLMAYVDSVARQQQYNDAVSCASYVNSNNLKWKEQAEVFISWRDSVYTYVIAQQILMGNGLRPIPTFENFQKELPVIVWPV